jgi:hypothetical protein
MAGTIAILVQNAVALQAHSPEKGPSCASDEVKKRRKPGGKQSVSPSLSALRVYGI